MKKALCICLAFLWLALSCTAAVFAEDAPDFSVGTVQGAAGDSVDVPITLEGGSGLIACRLYVSFDPSVLTLTGASEGTVFAGEYVFSNDLTSSPFALVWCDALTENNHTESGVLCVLHFTIASDAPAGSSALTLTYDANSTFDVNLQNVACTVQNGAVTVSPQETGGWSFSADSALHILTIEDKSYVTGLDADDPLVSDYVETTGGWSFTVTENEMDGESTGAVLTIYDENGDVAEQYETVLFGDIDGDGQCNIDDAMEIVALVCFQNDGDWVQYDVSWDNPQAFAADVDHDGEVTISDAMEIIAVCYLLQVPNQAWMSDSDAYMIF